MPGSEASHLFRNQYRGTECNNYTSPYIFLALYPIKQTDVVYFRYCNSLMVFVFKI
jgi:hypothetical protein